MVPTFLGVPSRLLTRLLSRFLCLVLASGLGMTVLVSPASATWTVYCTGYSGCARAGLSDAGYGQSSRSTYWRMYAGHNCTNYVAYRMVRSGLPNVRPWTGDGNAMSWGVAEQRLTTSVPAVGAVAWWRAYAHPAGSVGHVAYVERVLSPTEIVVSQDSWGGDFSWARITRSSGSWPSGFIHLNDVRLRNTSPPLVTGTPKVGSRLTASTGAWTPSPSTVGYRWQADGSTIAGATGSTLNLTAALQGKAVSVVATASRTGYPSASATSGRTRAVASNVLSNVVRPALTGRPQVGSTLTASPGLWTPSAATWNYRWTSGGKAVPGATAATLAIGPALVGKVLSVTVTASRAGFQHVSATAPGTAPVAPGTITVTRAPVITGTARPGRFLHLSPGSYSPAAATVSSVWRRAGGPLVSTDPTTYRLSTADLGRRLVVRTTVTSPGYAPLRATTWPPSRVRALPHLSVAARTLDRRVRLGIAVSAAGVNRVVGQVQVRWRGRLLEVLTLHGGTTTTTLPALPAGTRRIHVRYSGSLAVSARSVSRLVQVR